ncbi:MAG: flippase [Parcubacteria group bacterium]|jgi:O-antigen/teichoic acid export membrane protein
MKNFLQKKWHEYRAHHELRKIITNANWLFLDTAIRMAVAFFVGVWVIRYLGPEKYGVLSYAGALVGFFSVFSKLGLDAIAVRELVEGKIKKEKLLGTVFYLKLWGGMLAVVLAVVTAHVLKGDILITIITATVSFTLVFQAADVIDLWFQSQVVSKYVVYSRSAAVLISAAIKICLVSTGASLVWFASVGLLESIFVAIGFAFAYYKNKKHVSKWVFDRGVARDLLKDSWPLILSAISVMIYMRIDQVMIGNMMGYEALGSYSVAVNLSEMWYFIPTIITASVFPAIIVTKKRNEEEYYARLQKLYDMMVWMAIAIAIPMTFLSGWIINFLYGAEYAQAAGVLTIYIWAGVFVFWELQVESGL